MNTLSEILSSHIFDIRPADAGAMRLACERQARLAKPLGSLGTLEALSVQMAGITGDVYNSVEKKHLVVFAADHGVVAEGVASTPQSVTLAQTVNLTRGKTGAAVLAGHFGCGVTVCDVGVNAVIQDTNVLNRKVAFGTRNFTNEPAMTREQAETAILHGITLAREICKNADVIGVGEMGIGNTTAASAVLSVFSGLDAEEVTGRGAGLSDAAFENKKRVIRRAIAVNKPNAEDAVDVLCKVGGFDIAAMCGAFLGAAAERTPVVIDGFPSAVAALAAYRLCGSARDFFIPSHASREKGYAVAMDMLGLEPMLLLNMRLGEGSGCMLAFEILSAACAVMRDMATFDGAGIDSGYIDELMKNGDVF